MEIHQKELEKIKEKIISDPSNYHYTLQNFFPVYSASALSKIIIIGQAPSLKAQISKIAWNDLSGERLRNWLGVSKEIFYNLEFFSLIPMDFYYPGKNKTGDLPPRKDFAAKWHPQILANMPNVQLIILIGAYAQNYYLKGIKKDNLTNTVKAYKEYLPRYFPLVHPSPLNMRWQAKNPWFEKELIFDLQKTIYHILN